MENTNFALTERFNAHFNKAYGNLTGHFSPAQLNDVEEQLRDAFTQGAKCGTYLVQEAEATLLGLKQHYYQLIDGTFTRDTVAAFKLGCIKYEDLTGVYPTADIIDPHKKEL